PLFTVHGGEYLVGLEVERRFRQANVWVPSKDFGIDLLVTNATNRRAMSLQVKYSRDYSMNHPGVDAVGWWTLDRTKIQQSSADLWVFALQGFGRGRIHYVIIPPQELARRLRRIHGGDRKIQSDLLVTRQQVEG